MKQFSQYKMNSKNSALIELNGQLGSICVPHLINETWIVKFHTELISCHDPACVYFWLLYGRITEAALLCAGHYADNCEYSAAGDLLVNPRRIHLYSRKSAVIKLKNRHQSISEQFNPEGLNPGAFRKSFASSIKLSIEEEALLPQMANALAQSGLFCESYLRSIDERMKKIADTTAFLLAWSLDNVTELHQRLESASPESKKFIKHNLCRFTSAVFDGLGAELYCIEHNLPTTGVFFKRGYRRIMHRSHEEFEHDRRVAHH